MKVTANNFGILIAYVLPGFTAVLGAGYLSPTVAGWVGSGAAGEATVGGFLYVSVASIGAGLTASTCRWALLDTLHHRTGIKQTQLDFSRLPESLDAIEWLVQVHYRYYQFYGNMLVSLLFVFCARRAAAGFFAAPSMADAALLMIAALFYVGSRDTLQKYYRRGAELLGQRPIVLLGTSGGSTSSGWLPPRGL